MHASGADAQWADFSGRSDDFGLAAADCAPPLPPGTDLGGVTLVRLLAEGGMGRVYEAWQASPPRAVAVKIVSQRLPTPQALARFEYEATVLARLRHPHVAQIHTAGVFAGPYGRVPFLVMELVEEAQPITRFGSERELGIRARIALVRDVCAAVAHAHGRGVLHRDLKPANVLVAADGMVKVIDFGVARPTVPEPARGLTLGGQLVGTFAYMSPEQIRGDPEGIDVRSDVYALGLLLHEVVAGTLPYDLRGRSPVAAAELLASLEPGPAVLVEAAVRRGDGVSSAAARGLALVVGRCLAGEPARRYGSAAEVEAELGRWLAGEPLHARPATVAEIVRRFARRHRVAAAVVATGLACGVVGLAGIIGFALRAERQRELATTLAAESQARLQAADLLLAAAARDRGNVSEARRLLAEARALEPDPANPEPIERACLAASLDESLGIVARHAGPVTAVAWSADGRTVATAAGDGVVQLSRAPGAGPWPPVPADDTTRDGGEAAAAPGAGRSWQAHEATIWSIVFDPGGTWLATGSEDGTLRLWNAADGAAGPTLTDARGGVYGAAFSPAGDLLACGCRDGTVRIFELAGARERLVLSGHVGTVLATGFAPAGRLLATGGRDGTIRLWDPVTGERRGVLEGHAGRVFAVAFSPDGTRLASASEDGTARVWDLATAAAVTTLVHPTRVNGVGFVAADRIVTAAHDAVLRCWDVGSGRLVAGLRAHAGRLWAVATRPDGRTVTGSEDGTARGWNLDPEAGDSAPLGSRVRAVAVSGDGRLLAAGVGAGAVELRDPYTLAPLGPPLSAGSGVSSVAVSRDGRAVAAGCDDGSVHLFGRAPPGTSLRHAVHARPVFAVALSADGTRVLSASADRTARVTDVATGAAVGPPLRHPHRVYGATFAAGDRLVATACGDHVARLWRADDGTLVREFVGHTGQVNWVCFTADGTRLATASSDTTVRLWRVADGRVLAILAGPARQIWKVAVSPDGSRLAAAAADGDIHLWDLHTGRALPALHGHHDAAWAVAFAPDGRTLFSGGDDGLLRLWGHARAEIARRRPSAPDTAEPEAQRPAPKT